MARLGCWCVAFIVIITGCSFSPANYSKNDIIKITDFELSPDEGKIAFSAITPVGNLDIWVVGIDGKNLRKLTFKDHSPSNHIARFFKKHKWVNYFEIDMSSPKWTSDGRIAFCQKLTKSDIWGPHTLSLMFWTIKPDGTERKPIKPFEPVNRFEASFDSQKYKKKIFLKYGTLWYLNYGEVSPTRLIQ